MQVVSAIGPGGESEVLTGDQITQIYQKLGSTNLQLCYNAKIHGYNSKTLMSRCGNKGKTFTLMRRNNNGRVFGGYVQQNLRHTDWVNGNPSERPWLFLVNSGKKVEFKMLKGGNQHMYYMHTSYHMTWGGGHDLHCNQLLTHCYSNPSSYLSGDNKQLAGVYKWNHRGEGGSYGMVYEVYLIK